MYVVGCTWQKEHNVLMRDSALQGHMLNLYEVMEVPKF
jgi:hypothetical protein